MRKKTSENEDITALNTVLPEQHLEEVQAFAKDTRFEKTRECMAILSKNPPRSLLIEGGSAKDRFSASFYWSALLNCLDSAARPCLSCSACLSLINMAQRDFFFFDGSKSSITIELVKDSGIYASLGENPASASYRIVLFYEGQAFTDQSANTFLKALEDPQLSTVFILTAPQRERLLQTLVSRSWVITLPWPSLPQLQNRENQEQLLDLAGCLLDFVTGKNAFWMERTAQKGTIDKYLAMQVVLFCQKALVRALTDKLDTTASIPDSALPELALAQAFCALSPTKLHIANEALAECQDSLNVMVNPTLVLNWLATRLIFVFKAQATG